ncbi:hypothetical protein GOB57_22165 [Sinorhizobium meliloti]|nr:hypothetical protein [Sinorhizobium meliloti]
MNTTLPYTFTVRYLQPDKTAASTTHMVGYVTAEVPDLFWSDVTLVAEWINRVRSGVRRRCVSYEGSLYVSLHKGREGKLYRLPKSVGDPLPEPSYGFEIMGKGVLSRGEENLLSKAFMSDAKSQARLSGVIETNQRRNEAIARQCANSLLFVDGQVWKKVPWIALELSKFLDDFKVDVAHGATGFDDPGGDISVKLFQEPACVRRFSLDAIERVQSHSKGRDLLTSFRGLVTSAEVPEINSEEEFLLRCARYAVRKTLDDVGEMSPEAVNDWLWLRDAYESHVRDRRNGLPDDLGDTIRRFTPHIADERPRDHMKEAIAVLDVYDAERQSGATLHRPPGIRP